MKVIIVEDEALAAERLEDLILKYDDQISILEKFDTVQDTVNYLQSNGRGVDMIFMDIHLADGNSFEIFEKVKFFKPVIFTTAFDDYSIKAFKVNSIDYLLKPINYQELAEAIHKFEKLARQVSPVESSIDYSLVRPKEHPEHKSRFLAKYSNKYFYLQAADIAYFFADDKIVYAVSKEENKQYIVDYTLEQLSGTLLDATRFFRINRKFIVQLDVINTLRSLPYKRLEIKLTQPHSQPLVVSRDRITDFKKWLDR